MKIRTGFVSNSSSSSFIIAIKESVLCKHCGRRDPDIVELLEKSNDGETEVRAEGKVEILKSLRKGYWAEEEVTEIEEKFKGVGADEIVVYFDLSYSAETIGELIHGSKNINIIHEDG